MCARGAGAVGGSRVLRNQTATRDTGNDAPCDSHPVAIRARNVLKRSAMG